LIIAGALGSCLTGFGGFFALYDRYKLGLDRLRTIHADLSHLIRPVCILAVIFLVDKMIKLHKRHNAITYTTLWRSLPFDEDHDKDVVELIDDRIDSLVTQLEKRGKPLDLKSMANVIRAAKADHEEGTASQHGHSQLRHRRHGRSGVSSDSSGTAKNTGAGSQIIVQHALRTPPQVAVVSDISVQAGVSSLQSAPSKSHLVGGSRSSISLARSPEELPTDYSKLPRTLPAAASSVPIFKAGYHPQSSVRNPQSILNASAATLPSTPASQSTEHTLISLQLRLPKSPPRSRSRAALLSSIAKHDSSRHMSAATANTDVLPCGTIIHDADAPPPLTAALRLRVSGVQYEEC
jgi:hypothetical protein